MTDQDEFCSCGRPRKGHPPIFCNPAPDPEVEAEQARKDARWLEFRERHGLRLSVPSTVQEEWVEAERLHPEICVVYKNSTHLP